MKIYSVNADAKTTKSRKRGYLTGICYFAPYNLSGYQVCPKASKGCSEACLGAHAGRVKFLPTIMDSRIAKTRLYMEDREEFMLRMVKDLVALERKALREGFEPLHRPNGSSDIPYERVAIGSKAAQWINDNNIYAKFSVNAKMNIFEAFPHIRSYDYTKRPNRKDLPSNYSLTFSLAEDNVQDAVVAFCNGMNIAAVWRDELPEYLVLEGANGPVHIEVVNGDDHDARVDDPKGVCIGLIAKGDAKHDTTGFVRDTWSDGINVYDVGITE